MSAAAHARNVAPVVQMSSTTSSDIPSTPRAANAPRTFSTRARLASLDCRSRSFGRTSRRRSNRRLTRPASDRASSPAWLYPRSRSRREVIGTATIASKSKSPRSRTRSSSNDASGASRKSCRSNLNACSNRSSPSRYSPHASHHSRPSGSWWHPRQSHSSTAVSGAGCAQERHRAVSIRGRRRQQASQQEAVLPFHGSSSRQTVHQEGRTILSASRPSNEIAPRPAPRSAAESLPATQEIVRRESL